MQEDHLLLTGLQIVFGLFMRILFSYALYAKFLLNLLNKFS